MLHVEKCAMPTAMRASLRETADLPRQLALLARGGLILAVICSVPIAAFFVIGSVIDSDPCCFWPSAGRLGAIAAGSLVLGAIVAAIGLKGPFNRMREEAAMAAAHLKDGRCERVRLDLGPDHLVIDNDGQYFCFFPTGDGKVLFANVGGRENDPRLAAHARGDLFRATWWWKRLAHDPRIWDFETAGDRLAKVVMVAEPDNEDKDLTDLLGLDAWPRDGEVVNIAAGKPLKLAARWGKPR
jgi:hypothetical protein